METSALFAIINKRRIGSVKPKFRFCEEQVTWVLVAGACWLVPLARRMVLLTEFEGKPLPIDPRSLWPGLAASLRFRPESGVRGVVVVCKGLGRFADGRARNGR